MLSIVSLVGLDLFEEAERLEVRPLPSLLERDEPRVEALRLESAPPLWFWSNPPNPNPFATAAPTIAAMVNLQSMKAFFILSVIY